jgi:Holliday junction resolvase RusA-like endonuclease
MVSLPVTPIGKPRMTRADKWRQRKPVLDYRAYCDTIREQLPGYTLPTELHLTFFIPMPLSWSRKRRAATLGAPHDQKPDIDNLVKGFMDAFKDEAGKTAEDKHVYSLTAEKYWSEEGSIEITL